MLVRTIVAILDNFHYTTEVLPAVSSTASSVHTPQTPKLSLAQSIHATVVDKVCSLLHLFRLILCSFARIFLYVCIFIFLLLLLLEVWIALMVKLWCRFFLLLFLFLNLIAASQSISASDTQGR